MGPQETKESHEVEERSHSDSSHLCAASEEEGCGLHRCNGAENVGLGMDGASSSCQGRGY